MCSMMVNGFQAEAKKLNGQLMLLNRNENDCVFFDVMTLSKRTVCFGARNRLTTATAFSLLHFLEHLRNSAFHIVTIGAGGMDGFDDGAFNSAIFSALALPRQPFKMVCKWARPSYHNHDAFRLPLVKSIRQFIKPVSLFCYVSATDRPAALQLISNGRVHISKMVCRSMEWVNERIVSEIIGVGPLVRSPFRLWLIPLSLYFSTSRTRWRPCAVLSSW